MEDFGNKGLLKRRNVKDVTEMETYYIKKGRKYIALGWQVIGEALPFGVWYSRKTEGGSSHTNLLFWDKAEILDIKKAISQVDLTDKISDILSRLNKDKQIGLLNMSYHDFAREIAKEVLK